MPVVYDFLVRVARASTSLGLARHRHQVWLSARAADFAELFAGGASFHHDRFGRWVITPLPTRSG